jgi:hypothetical protein
MTNCQMTEVPFVVAVAVAVAAWAIAKEELFKELRDICDKRAKNNQYHWLLRKIAYMPICEYCASFWVSLIALLVLQYQVIWDDWRGYCLAQFFTWGLAVAYLALYQLCRTDIRFNQAKVEAEKKTAGAIDWGH